MTGNWTLSVWSDSRQDKAVVQSMLALMKGGAVDAWSYSEASTADLLLGNSSSPPPRDFSDKDTSFVVARLLEPGASPRDDGALEVCRPMRAMHFLDLLNEASLRLRQQAISRAPLMQETARVGAGPDQSQIAAAQALFEIRRSRHDQPVALTKDGSLLAMVNLGRGAVASGLGMTQLLANVEQNFASLEPRTNHHWEEALAQWGAQSLDALCWQLGQKMAQRIGLAPWLHDSTPYRLISWPDFGAIGNDRLGFKLAAQMSKRPLSVTQLSEISGASPGLIVSFLNSVSLCGLLVAGPGAAPAVVARRPPASARLSMISRLRTRLGL